MKVEVKNLLYQPLPLMLTDGRIVNIQARKKKVLDKSLVVTAQITTLKKREQIKYKELS